MYFLGWWWKISISVLDVSFFLYEEGLKGLIKGLLVRILVMVLLSLVMVFGYEIVKRFSLKIVEKELYV